MSARLPRGWTVGLAVLAFHVVWVGVFFAWGNEIRDLVRIGTSFVTQSDASELIELDPNYDYPENNDARFAGEGFDGQFNYYIAVDPKEARHYIDDPGYRYSRILYPLAARGLTLGSRDAIPYALLLINLFAVALGTAALGAWMAARSCSEWWALVYGLFPGLLISVQRDLSEPLAFALVAAAVYMFDFGGRRGVVAGGGAFGLAGLARETTLIFPLLYALSILAGRPNASRDAGARPPQRALLAGFVVLAFAPAALWAGARLGWLDSLGSSQGRVTAVPLGGFLEGPWELSRRPLEAVLIALPALIWVVAAFRGGMRDGRLERACFVGNVALIVLFTGSRVWESYTGVGRAATGMVLAALLCVPYARREDPVVRRLLMVAASLWLVLLPVVFVYGLGDFRV